MLLLGVFLLPLLLALLFMRGRQGKDTRTGTVFLLLANVLGWSFLEYGGSDFVTWQAHHGYSTNEMTLVFQVIPALEAVVAVACLTHVLCYRPRVLTTALSFCQIPAMLYMVNMLLFAMDAGI
jgi:hypothetical protein